VNLLAWKQFQDQLTETRNKDSKESAEFAERKPLTLVHSVTDAPSIASAVNKMTPRVPLQCDHCHIKSYCPRVLAGSQCRYSFEEIYLALPYEQALTESTVQILKVQYERIMRAVNFERARDGVLDAAIQKELDTYFRLLEKAMKILKIGKGLAKLNVNLNAEAKDIAPGGILHKYLSGEKDI